MSKKNIASKNSKSHNELIEDSWELAGNELLFPKDKLNYTEQELIRLKKLLIISPPPIEYRKIVRIIIKTIAIYINK
jgi:hypothetical protein